MNKIFDFSPFDNIHDYIKAVIIVNKLYSKSKNNVQQIHKCIVSLVAVVAETDIIRFISLAINSTRKHPYEILGNIDDFKSKIDQYCIDFELASIVIESPATKCLFCEESQVQWFVYANPVFSKDAILFSKSKIGKL